MAFTIPLVAAQPLLLRRNISWLSGRPLLFPPLEAKDVQELCEFLESLSEETRFAWRRERYDIAEAQELCEAIGHYDKLRLIVVEKAGHTQIQGLFELSFAIPESDQLRFAQYGVPLDDETDCRLGVCVRDAQQGTGLASAVMPLVQEVMKGFGRSRLLLWGGVLDSNVRARRFYEKHGFQYVGRFLNRDGGTQASICWLYRYARSWPSSRFIPMQAFH